MTGLRAMDQVAATGYQGHVPGEPLAQADHRQAQTRGQGEPAFARFDVHREWAVSARRGRFPFDRSLFRQTGHCQTSGK